MLLLLTAVTTLGTFGVGVLVGWLLAKERRLQAVIAFVLGGVVLLAVLAGLFAMLHVAMAHSLITAP